MVLLLLLLLLHVLIHLVSPSCVFLTTFGAAPQRCMQSQLFVIWCCSQCSKHRGTPPSIIQTGTSAPSAERISRLCASFREGKWHLLTWTNAANQRLPERHGEEEGYEDEERQEEEEG